MTDRWRRNNDDDEDLTLEEALAIHDAGEPIDIVEPEEDETEDVPEEADARDEGVTAAPAPDRAKGVVYRRGPGGALIPD